MTFEIHTLKDARECYIKLCDLSEFSCYDNSNITCLTCMFKSSGVCKLCSMRMILKHAGVDNKIVVTSDEWDILYNTILELVSQCCNITTLEECKNCCMWDEHSVFASKCKRVSIREVMDAS